MWKNQLDSEFWCMCRVRQVNKALKNTVCLPHVLSPLGEKDMWHKLKRTCDSFV
jgi:hypothetical protein